MLGFTFFLFFLSSFLTCLCGASPYGYTKDVQAERSQSYREIVLQVPRLRSEAALNDLIFNPLKQEFQQKYNENFGENDTRSIVYLSQLNTGVQVQPQAIEQETQKRKLFAEYMVKRLVDYHVDNFMKTKPEMRPIMEVKEKIQNVKVEVSQSVRLNIRYNIVVNFAEIIIENPYVESKLALEMNPRSFGPSNIDESRFWVSKNLNADWRLNSNIASVDGIAYGDITHYLHRQNAQIILSASTYFRETGKSLRQSLYMLSLAKTF